jgi:hypothetical protein
MLDQIDAAIHASLSDGQTLEAHYRHTPHHERRRAARHLHAHHRRIDNLRRIRRHLIETLEQIPA